MMVAGLCALHGLFGHVHREAAVIASGPLPSEAARGEMLLAAILVSACLLLAAGFASIRRSPRRPDPTPSCGLGN